MLLLALGACREKYAPPSPASYHVAQAAIRIGSSAETIWTARVSPDFFQETGVEPLIGRLFLPTEYGPTGDLAVVLSQPIWKRRFSADPSLIGQKIQIDGGDFTVIGVLPQSFTLPEGAELLVPQR